jgi:hypothetical protein
MKRGVLCFSEPLRQELSYYTLGTVHPIRLARGLPAALLLTRSLTSLAHERRFPGVAISTPSRVLLSITLAW